MWRGSREDTLAHAEEIFEQPETPVKKDPRQADGSSCFREPIDLFFQTTIFSRQFNLIWVVQSAPQKHSAFHSSQITGLCPAIPFHPRGVSRSSRTLGCGIRWTQWRTRTNGAGCGRRSRVVLTPRRWRLSSWEASFSGAMVARKPGHQGELGVSRKTIVQGMPGRFRRTCGDYRVLSTFCTRAAGATGTRHSLRPLYVEGQR
jgi:hypothetical protein